MKVETWFDWTEIQRDEYLKKVNAMSVEDMLKGKRVSVGTADKTSTCSNREFGKTNKCRGEKLQGITMLTIQLYEGTLSVHHQRLHRDPSRRLSHIA